MNKEQVLLTPRLQTVADLIGRCNSVCDVGTDHAYLPIYLTENNLVDFCIASDIAEGPLSRARGYIERHLGKTERIKTVLSDGLKNISEPTDVITVTGMGGETIIDILKNGNLHQGQILILQPMSKSVELRKYLFENNFRISDEVPVAEDYRIYTVIKAEKAETKYDFSESECWFSLPLRLKKSNEAKLYKAKVIKSVKNKLDGLKNASEKDESEINRVWDLYNELLKIGDLYESK